MSGKGPWLAVALWGALAGCDEADCVPSAERCDGRDDDCDGLVDEAFPLGRPCAVGLGVCTAQGVLACMPGGGGVRCDASPPAHQAETCDGRDNDCDGGVDEGGDLLLMGEVGSVCGDRAGACTPGVMACRGGRLLCAGGQAPRAERCDGVDNDCDGLTDEGDDLLAAGQVGRPCGSEKGACEGDRSACVDGAVVCVRGAGPLPEACDGLDNDCDGRTDEEDDLLTAGLIGGPCGAGEGLCALGRTECSGGGLVCVGGVTSSVEVCDGLDNDCDGVLDEVGSGEDQGCGSDVGVCRRGEVLCVAGQPRCEGEIVGTAETCDGLDNDCDGGVDEAVDVEANGQVGRECGVGLGVCVSGVLTCDAGELTCSGQIPPSDEVCDGLDNDCDGGVDEALDLGLLEAVGQACGSDVGACASGVRRCVAGQLSCVGRTPPSDEVCDGLDNDCDGSADEGFEGLGLRCERQGACQVGAMVCRVDGAALCCSADPDCEPDRVVGDELCDGLDNDCDGVADEGLTVEGRGPGDPCQGVGVCGGGVVECLDVRTLGCSAGPGGSAFGGRAETCDGLDDDCDGLVDEGFLAGGLGVGEPCGGVGRCGPGLVECAGPDEVRCSTLPGGRADGSRPETCDGLDDDCDGSVDEGFGHAGLGVGQPCPGVGVCPEGTVECAQGVAVCSTGPGGSDDRSAEERCDGRDVDCDGAVDEGWMHRGRPVGALCDGVGRCAFGVVECGGDGLSVGCSTDPGGGSSQDRAERCDGLDDDCDGSVDEDFAGLGQACDGADEDLCQGGLRRCSPDGLGLRCEGDEQAFIDVCNGLDDDCDGAVDEAGADLRAACVGRRRHVVAECVVGRCEVHCLDGFADDDGDLAEEAGNGCEAYSGPRFTDVTAAAGVSYLQLDRYAPGICTLNGGHCLEDFMAGGAATADYDGDGRPDLYVTRLHGRDVLFRNLGDGVFEDVTLQAGLVADLQTNGAVFCDLDNDGDPDLYVTTMGEDRFLLYINDEGVFSEQGRARGAALDDPQMRSGFSVSCGDFDRDGWADLHVTENRLVGMGGPDSWGHNRLLRNRGSSAPAVFDDVTDAAGVSMDLPGEAVHAFTSTFTDFDDDGWPDLAVVADFGTSRLFWNRGDGTFADGTGPAGVGLDDTGMGSAVGDFDGDGRLDWFVTAIYEFAFCDVPPCPLIRTGNKLYRNEGGRRFTERAEALGVQDAYFGWGTAFLDYDNDGDLDLVATNGANLQPWNEDPMRLWRNDGGAMSEVSAEAGMTDRGDGKGLLVFDYDDDGDLDVFVVRNEDTPRLYRNDGVEAGRVGGWLRVLLRGRASPADALGARVTLHTVGGGPPQVREVRAGGAYLSQHEATLHFGLGADEADRAVIRWPRDGALQVVRRLPRNATVVVTEP